MALFNFRAKKAPVEVRHLPENNYTYPVGLSFLRQYGLADTLSLSAVYAAVSLISNSIAQIPIHIRDTETGTILNHPINLALNHGLITKFQLMRGIVGDMLLHGDGLAYIERATDGTPTSLIYCPHGSYNIFYNQHSHQLYYQLPDITKKKVEPINVIHIYKDSKDGVKGRSLNDIAADTLALTNAAESAAKDYYESGCNVDAVLKSSRPLTNEQRTDIKTQWMSARSQNGGRGTNIAVLGSDLDYTPIGTTASEAQLLETRAFNIDEIARYFNISPQLLGDLDHTQYGSLEQAQLDFVMHCLHPYIAMIEDEFNRKLLKPSESNLHIDLDENHLMKADKAATATYLSTLTNAGIMSINEARHMIELAPVDGGDDLIIPYTKVDDNKIGTSGDKNITQ